MDAPASLAMILQEQEETLRSILDDMTSEKQISNF